jgi:hypothetical protein
MPTITCDTKLAGDFSRICGFKTKEGIKRKWYFNWDDVDRTTTTVVNKGTKVTVLTLKTGAKIYEARGTTKTLKNNHKLSVLDYGNGYIHTDMFTLDYHGENERQRIQELVDGGRICSIVEKIDTGLNGELTYEIYGLESGMTITEDNYDSSANSGATTITVATEKGTEEATGKKLFLLATGTAATATWINTNTYVAP